MMIFLIFFLLLLSLRRVSGFWQWMVFWAQCCGCCKSRALLHHRATPAICCTGRMACCARQLSHPIAQCRHDKDKALSQLGVPAWLETPDKLWYVTHCITACIRLPAWLKEQEKNQSDCGSVVHNVSFALPLLLQHTDCSPVHWCSCGDSSRVAATLLISDHPMPQVRPLGNEAWKSPNEATRPPPDMSVCHLPLPWLLQYLDTFMEGTHYSYMSRTEPPQLPALFHWYWHRVVVCTQNPSQVQKVILLRAQHFWVISHRVIDDESIQSVLLFIRAGHQMPKQPHKLQRVINTRFFPPYVPKAAQLLPHPAARVQEP